MLNESKKRMGIAAGIFLALATIPCSASAENVVLFQPGQSSWEWLLVPALHDGGKQMREGKSCLHCHEGEEKTIGNLIASGEKLEPKPISGMPGFVEMSVDAAYDDENLYLTLSWPDLPEGTWGDEEAATHLTVSLGSDELNVAPIAGCWAACHNDMRGMPDATADDLTKYLPGSRNKMTRSGGGTDIKSEAELAALVADGEYLELWQAVLDGGELQAARDGHILEERVLTTDSVVAANVIADGQRTTVELVRPLQPEGQARHALSEGVAYTLNIALHANHADGRHHYTAFPMRLLLGPGEAELNASRR